MPSACAPSRILSSGRGGCRHAAVRVSMMLFLSAEAQTESICYHRRAYAPRTRVRHWLYMVRLGRSAPYVPGSAQNTRLFRVLLGWTAPRHRVPDLGCQRPRQEPSMSEIKRIGIDTSKAV